MRTGFLHAMTSTRLHRPFFLSRLFASGLAVLLILLGPAKAMAAAPTITSISPFSATAGGAAFTLTVNGTNFDSTAKVKWNGSIRTTTYVSATQVKGAITAADIATAGGNSVSVNTTSGGDSLSSDFVVSNPPPTITSISPTSAPQLSNNTITINGSNFQSCTTIYVESTTTCGGQPCTQVTTGACGWPSTTQLLWSNPNLFMDPGAYILYVTTNSGALKSNSVPLTITAPPPPTITSVNPFSTTAGGAQFTLTVNGTNLTYDTQVKWNGSPRTPSFVSNTQVTTTITAADIATGSTSTITVSTPGGTSSGVNFTVNNPVPTLTSLSVNSCTAPCSTTSIALTGTNFVSASQIQWDGSTTNVTTTFTDSTHLTATLNSTLLTTAGAHSITVFNSSPGGGTSSPLTFTVNKANQTITFSALANKLTTDSPFTVSATSTSGLTVTFTSATTGICTVSGTTVTLTGTSGTCTINANQAGNATYNAAPQVSQGFTSNNPIPTLSNLSVTSCTAPCTAQTVALTGTNFVSGSQIRWDGSTTSVTTTYTNSISLNATTASSLLTVGGTHTLTVFNPTPGGGTSIGQTFTINYPVPTTSSLSPSSVTAGNTTFTLTVNGTGFFSSVSTVNWNGSAMTTTYVSSTQLTASIPASNVTTPGIATVTVSNLTPGGGTSIGQTFTINYPVPTTSDLSPTSTIAPGSLFTLTVNGTNFFSGISTIRWNGSNRTTTFVNSTQLTADIPASDVAMGGTATVTVFNATPGGGTSGGQTFTINNPAPTLASLSPTSTNLGGATFTLTVTGSNFVNGSTVQWNGSSRTTTYVSDTQLTASIPASDTPITGTATVTVTNPAPGGGTSGGQTFTITYPTPTLSSVSPNTTPMGNGDLTVTATGTGFYTGVSTVQWNGTPLATTYVDATHLTAVILAANLTGPDTVNLTIFTGGPGGGASNAKAFTILPTLSIGPLTQDGWNVTAAVTWPTAPTVTNQVTNCGTTTTQTFAGSSGTCVYTKAGPFTITGTSTVGGTPSVQGPSQTVAIPLIVPTTATLSATVNGLQPAADGTISPFHFPASAATAITLVRPLGIGIVDPLDLNASRLAITPAGGTPSNFFVRAGVDVLQTTATGQLDAAATYTLQLNGQTVSGQAVTGSLTLIVAQGSPVLIFGNMVQDGFNVLMTVSWPNDLQGAVPTSINCGTPATQFLTGPTGVCRYTTADTFQLRGSYKSPETGAPTLQTTLQPVTIPLRVPTGANLAFEVNAVPVTGSSITAYRFPAIVKSTAILTLPAPIGIIDQLDVGPSRLSIGRTGGSTTAYRLSLGTDQALTTNLSSFDAPGDYTVSLAGQTVHGNAVMATQTLTVTAANVSLILGSLVQDGDNVAVSVTWPDGVTPVGVTCGTSSLQTFTGPAGVCSYARPGSFQIAGTFVNPEDNTRFAAAPATVTIPAIAPVNPQITLQVNNQPVTDSASTYRVPSLLKAIITMQRPAGIGVLDQLDTQNSRVSISPDGMAPTRYRPVVRDNLLLATADGEVRRGGAHTIAFEGKTLSGQTLSASAALMVVIGKATLLADPPAQDGNAVIVRVRWPDNGPTGKINCGFMSQTLTAPSGTCRYTRAGSYQIVGFFPDPARGSTVLTDPVLVTIPLLAPTQALLSIVSVNSAGVSSDTTSSSPFFTTLQPQTYPVGVRLKIAFTRPDGIGVLDVIDRSRSSLTATAAGDGASPIPVAMSFGSAPSELTALASLRTFPPDPTTPSRWRYQFTFTGQSLGGSTYSAQAELAGSIGGLSPITLQVSRATPSIPYAPATYQYSLTGARSATLGEPLTAAWTVTPDGQPPGQTVQNSRMMVTFEGPGTYQIQLVVRGPLSGSTTWFDTVTVPALAAADAPTIVTRVPEQNRPPAAYRFTVTTLPMADPRERIGVPTWTVEGTTVSTPALVTTFTAAGPHQIGVSVPTSYGRTLDAQTTVTVNPNQPPVGTVDCSRSSYRQLTKKYALYCRATAADPDGRIGALKWNIPELQYERLDTTVLLLERDQPVAITVELHITDNSGDETVVTVPIDMASLPVQ